MTPDALASVEPTSLARFLATRRWFGARDRTIAAASLRAVAPLDSGPAPTILACVRVRFVDGETTDHQLPLATRAAGDEADVVAHAADLQIVDAVALPAFRQRLGDAFARGETITGAASRWVFEAIGDLGDLGGQPSRIVGGEQSNTSIVYGDRAILKMFRRLEPGIHPDVEICRFLTTRTRFRGTPALLGVAHLHADDGTCVAGMVQEFMPGAVDGWSHVLASLRAGADGLPRELAALGALTRELHTALASAPDDPDFAPEPTHDIDLERWQAATETQVRGALDRLAGQQASLPAAILPDIERVLSRRDDLVARLRTPLDAGAAGPRIRHHGDYHLGQVLHADHGWKIIDFEGEPARPLAERRARHHPLRDVAGMLRSFAYAAAVAAPDRAAEAEQSMRTAFLAGYDLGLASDPRRAGLLELFTAEKLFYELAYELGSRPAWVWIPLAGIAALETTKVAR